MNELATIIAQFSAALSTRVDQAFARADAAEAKIAALSRIFNNENEGQSPIIATSGISPPAKSLVVSATPRRRGDPKYPDSIFLAALTTIEQTATELYRKLHSAGHEVSEGTVHGRYTKLANDPASGVERGAKGWRLKGQEAAPVTRKGTVALNGTRIVSNAANRTVARINTEASDIAAVQARARKYEVFRTPTSAFTCLLDYRPEWFEGIGFDPSAGDGRMLREIIDRGNTNHHFANDVREEEFASLSALPNTEVTISDYLTMDNPPLVDFTITNPPFTKAQAMVVQALAHTRGHVCILQSHQWLGSRARAPWFKKSGLSHILNLEKRPTFEVDSGVKVPSRFYNFAWFVFQPNFVGQPTIDWLSG